MVSPLSRSKPTAPREDREPYEPAYALVARVLSQEIARGVYRPGDRLPSESQLRVRFGVSGMTVRRAMNILVDHGAVTASQGKGVFVRGLHMHEAAFYLRERQEDVLLDSSAEVRLQQASILPADQRVARKLGIEPGTRVIYLRRLVLKPDGPVMLHREYIVYDPRAGTVEAELQITSLEGLLRGRAGDGLRRGDLALEATVLNEEEAELLQAPVGSPALCLEHVFYDFQDRPVAWGWFLGGAERFRLVARIGGEIA
ncbi:MAG: putative HTH-type transcriptional regulator YurK [Chloroflexi bacterium ADurb.Bin180]|nr:MAG: putative HTH-type transcriptional regulator YurK [Chloroflexi bacterium ADurb.Bin180]